MKKCNELIKRIFDFLASMLGILILSPVLLIVAIAIKIDSKGNILFLQKRIGRNGIPFYIYKFRTMVSDAEKLGKQITVGKDNRITNVGSILRKYKIDELPQLFNVLKGDMSLVGPRPEVPKYVQMYTESERKVLEVRPGITDLASLRYKDENDILGKVDNPEEYYINVIMKDKLKLNLEYIEKSNLIFDISLIFKTIIKCL
ncbi:sugar transferase [Clostridium sartagoforme AAU1]|uniref:Sugar transferase n=1 Tax=Clostridium sartagoforme AAU1 TaxID=1202534 RepID=R9C5S8_9CLOT|nr:sugar transferase [Clostridium sartagoforme]EOR24643.1 sugar transferase [Clostridium sartagoforme AAU1]